MIWWEQGIPVQRKGQQRSKSDNGRRTTERRQFFKSTGLCCLAIAWIECLRTVCCNLMQTSGPVLLFTLACVASQLPLARSVENVYTSRSENFYVVYIYLYRLKGETE